MVTCPLNSRPGQTIRFKLPVSQASEAQDAVGKTISYENEAWIRCLGADMKLHWAPNDDAIAKHAAEDKEAKGEAKDADAKDGGADAKAESKDGRAESKEDKEAIEVKEVYDRHVEALQEAFVRQYDQQGSTATVAFVPAQEYTLEFMVPGLELGYNELIDATKRPFAKKVEWFNAKLARRKTAWEYGHVKINVRRKDLLQDCVMAFNSVKADDLRKVFRFEFLGEPGLDATGVTRELFDQASEQLFNPDFGFFMHSGVDQSTMQINPDSELVNEEHKHYFFFAGRLIGKALFDGQVIKAHLVKPLFKHLLGWPIMFRDLEYVDAVAYKGMMDMCDMLKRGEDISMLCLDFMVTTSEVHQTQEELKAGGRDINVDNSNVTEYLQLIMKYKVCCYTTILNTCSSL
jgi:hypothetical protein